MRSLLDDQPPPLTPYPLTPVVSSSGTSSSSKPGRSLERFQELRDRLSWHAHTGASLRVINSSTGEGGSEEKSIRYEPEDNQKDEEEAAGGVGKEECEEETPGKDPKQISVAFPGKIKHGGT